MLLNLGGPETQDQVEPFLERLFSDRDLIKLPFQQYTASWIAKRRSPRVRAQYAEIGGGSPILSWTQRQGRALEKLLDECDPKAGKNPKKKG